MAPSRDVQTELGFTRLTPLADAQKTLLALLPPITSETCPVSEATGRVLAQSLYAPYAVPATALALRDGFAVIANETIGATPYAPNYALETPPHVRLGAPLPEGANAMLPAAAVAADRMPVEIFATAAPGDNIRRAGGDFAAGDLIRAAGERLQAIDIALLRHLDITEVSVAKASVAIIAAQDSVRDAAIAEWLKNTIAGNGGDVAVIPFASDPAKTLAHAFEQHYADLIVMTETAADIAGLSLTYGIAVQPGESAGFGAIKKDGAQIPVVAIPNRFESALATWLLLLRPCLDALLGARVERPRAHFSLSRKIVSAPGRADLVILRRKLDGEASLWEPLATGDIPWHALVAAEAWLLVAPESEGMPAGQHVFAEYL